MILFQKQFKQIVENFHNAKVVNDRPLCVPECAAALENAHVFMFKSFDAQKLVKDSSVEVVDLPFKKCVFEVQEGMFFYYTPQQQNAAKMFGSQLRHVRTFLVEETSPLKYNVYLCAESKDGNWLSFHNYWSETDNGDEFRTILSLIQSVLNSFRGQSFAREIVKESMKIKVNGKKKQININTITHVYPDKLITPKGLHGKILEWSHRWEVRGHWRKIKGKGKDRTGSYTQEGFTWVLNHEKGPLDKELVQKTRVVNL